ncbi:hypothetical protein ACFO4M_10785 [Pseudonocardia nematodicida]
MGRSHTPLTGRIVGYAVLVMVVAVAARTTYELLAPLLPWLSGLVVLGAIGYWVQSRRF